MTVKVLNNTLANATLHGFQFWGNWKYEVMDCADLIFTGNIIRKGGGGAIWGTEGECIVIANNTVNGAEDVGLDRGYHTETFAWLPCGW